MAFVGKGITYDTGGLNIKATGFMEDMHGDKGGACAVLGALKGSLELKPKKNIIFACAFAENAIGS
jgi:leucyl aminopeptidase